MNRRSFLQSTSVLPLMGFGSVREVRAALLIAREVNAHFIVAAHTHPDAAEDHRRDWIARPFEGEGEWYLDSTEMRDLPSNLADLPGILSFHTATVGAAAARHAYLVGAFRRDHISYIVRFQSDSEDLMIDIAEFFAAQSLPGVFEAAWSSSQLLGLIPDSNDLGVPVEEVKAFWP